jgi:hypothetical protein
MRKNKIGIRFFFVFFFFLSRQGFFFFGLIGWIVVEFLTYLCSPLPLARLEMMIHCAAHLVNQPLRARSARFKRPIARDL